MRTARGLAARAGPPWQVLSGRIRASNCVLSDECVAGGGGFEPPLTGPEPVVLPLDDPPAYSKRPHYTGPPALRST